MIYNTLKFKILSLNISEQKGTVKKPVSSIILNETGVQGDAHSGKWHRQVSLLGKESFDRFAKMAGRFPEFGEFAENITTEGIQLFDCKPLDRFVNERIILEVTQIGKKCHGSQCAIFKEVGDCIMPTEGIFCRVIVGGKLTKNDYLEYQPHRLKILIITLSDRASAGEYSDASGPAIKTYLEKYFISVKREVHFDYQLIPDDPDKLERIILKNQECYDFIFTTGGTGIGPRDFTPDVVKKMIDREIPGIMENIRIKFGQEKPNALLSRAIAGTKAKTIIYTLPGSVKAVNEYCSEIIKTMEHALLMLHGIDGH